MRADQEAPPPAGSTAGGGAPGNGASSSLLTAEGAEDFGPLPPELGAVVGAVPRVGG